MGLNDKTDGFDNLCSDPSGNTRSEPNNILEVNESHSDNFLLVIPELPTAQYLSSFFHDVTHAKEFFATVGTSGTSATSGSNNIADECETVAEAPLRRETNLDLMNFRLYVSDVVMPTVSINKVTIGTQMADMNRGSKIQFTDLTTTMLVSENFLNYNAVLYWMYALHNPVEYNKIFGRQMIDKFFTNIHLIITNNHREKVAEFEFIDSFPYNLTSLPFSYKSAEKLTADVTWTHSGIRPTNNFVLKYI